MRLSQLARTYDIPLVDIVAFLKTEVPEEKTHPNSKPSNTTMKLLEQHFGFDQEFKSEESERGVDDKMEGSEEVDFISNSDANLEQNETEETPPSSELEYENIDSSGHNEERSSDQNTIETDSSVPENEISEELDTPPTADETILSDQLLEMLENEEETPELDNIKLIKAPKKELDGLKVLGKVDPEELERRNRKREKAEKKEQNRKPAISEEEKEKRRLRAKRKKEAYEARQEKREKEKEKARLKAIKEQRYKERLAQTQAIQNKHRPKKQLQKSQVQSDGNAQPKTLWGKFMRWLNT